MHKVTDADRKAAAALLRSSQTLGAILEAGNIEVGRGDNNPQVQAFAAHRIATIEECAKAIDDRAAGEHDLEVWAYLMEAATAIRNMKGEE